MTLLRTAPPLACILTLVFSVSCTPASAPGPGTDGTPGRVVSEIAADEDGVTRILLYYDMEGLSGQENLWSSYLGSEEYPAARGWLTDDVNAVIEGLFAGGADVVDVVDAHGSGNPEPDIHLERMDSRAQLLFRDEPFRPYVDLVEAGTYDAVALVGMHSRTGGGGFGAHTYNPGTGWVLNGMFVNETEIIAYSWGRVDVPVVFASGGDRLSEQLEWMDWLEYVTVKGALSHDHAIPRPTLEVHEDMRAAAARAILNLPRAKAVALTTPVWAQLQASPPARLDHLDGVPGVEYEDQAVTFEAMSFRDAYDGMEALIGVASQGRTDLLWEVLGSHPAGAEITNLYRELVGKRWLDVESGRWESPGAEPPEAADTRYFGAS